MNTYRITFEGHARNLAGEITDVVEDVIIIDARSREIEDVQSAVEELYGQDFGSFYLNGIEDAHKCDDVKVGDGVTHTIHTDRRAGTVIKRTAKSITMQYDKATLLNGMNSDADDKLHCSPGGFAGHVSGSQRYSYETDSEGYVAKFTRREITRRDGTTLVVWLKSGHRTRSPGNSLNVGRHEHYDYNF